MIMDAQLLASDGQVVTTTANSTNTIDLGSVARDISRGEPVRAVARAVVGFAGGSSIQANLVESDFATLSPNNVIVTGAAVNAGAAAAGAVLLDAPLPKVSRRYLGFNYIVVSGPMTGGGAVTAGLVLESDSGAAYPANTGL